MWFVFLIHIFLIVQSLRPKLQFYLFPLTRPTLKKGHTQKSLFQFQSGIYLFLISLQPERIVQCKQCYLSKLFVYLILLPRVGLYSKTCLKRPLKDIRKGLTDKWALNAGRKNCRAFCNTFDLQYAMSFLSGLLRPV